MPKPAAEFSAFAITKSMLWYSTRPRRPSRTSSRPGRPTISPMKRMRTADILGQDRYLDGPAAAIGDLRDRHAELAVTNEDRKSTRLNSSHANISYAVFCL